MTKPIKSIEVFTEILDHVVTAGEPVTATELAGSMAPPASTLHGYLRTMEQTGWLVNVDGAYRHSTQLLETWRQAHTATPAGRFSEEYLQELAAVTGQTASLMIVEDGYGVVVDRHLEGPTDECPDLGVPYHLPTTAAGKAILARLPEERRDALLEDPGFTERTANTVTSRDVLLEELAEIESQGYATDSGEWFRGIECIAAPIITESKGVVGSLSVSYPTAARDEEPFDAEQVAQQARRVTNQMQIAIDNRTES
jgi:DNA-binding IclR family transcriptional regulator